MPTTTRYSVAKTQKSYSAQGLAAIQGSTVKSETEQWNGGVAYPPSQRHDSRASYFLILIGVSSEAPFFLFINNYAYSCIQ